MRSQARFGSRPITYKAPRLTPKNPKNQTANLVLVPPSLRFQPEFAAANSARTFHLILLCGVLTEFADRKLALVPPFFMVPTEFAVWTYISDMVPTEFAVVPTEFAV